jgi:hypothetical protein
MTRLRHIAITLLLTGAAAIPSLAQSGNCTQKDEATRPDCPGAIAFFNQIHNALAANNRQKLASLMNYPLRARSGQKSILIRSPSEFLTRFDETFDAGVRCSILGAQSSEVWGNSDGFTVGSGAIWFEGIIPKGEHPNVNAPDYWTKYPFKIITVNNEAYYPCAPR